MAYPVPHFLSRIGSAGNGIFYPTFSGFTNGGVTTEAEAQVEMTFDGTFSDFESYTRVSNGSGTTTFTLRKNGVDTALTWTVPQSNTGTHGDNTNTVSFVAGDLFSIGITTSAGSISELNGISFKISSDDNETRRVVGTFDAGSINFTTVPRYMRIEGELLNNLSTEATSQILIHNDCVLEAVSVYVPSNTRTADGTVITRINTASGALSVTIPSSTTGLFTQSGGSDAVVVDDLINTRINAGGTGTISVRYVALTIKSDNPREITIGHGNNISRPATDTSNDYNMPGNRMSTSPTELAYSVRLKSGGVLSRMSIYASADTATTDLDVVMRVNGADGNQTLTQSSAGWLTDTTNSDTIDNNDYISQRTTRASVGSGTTTLRANSFLFTMDAIVADTFLPQIIMF